MATHSRPRQFTPSDRGFSLIELLITLGITTLVLGATMAALGDAVKMADAATFITGLNDNLRNSTDIMVRDLLQTGQGLPSGRVIQIPSGAGSVPMRVPGPPLLVAGGATSAYLYTGTDFCPPPSALCTQVAAIIPGPGRGPTVSGQVTDMITMLAADGAFDQIRLTALAANGSSATIETLGPDNLAGTPDDINITNGGPDDLDPGDLLMLTKGSTSSLVQISRVVAQQVFFDAADSLRLNQVGPPGGTVPILLNTAPVDAPSPVFLPTTVTRIRMISYYIDISVDPQHPRLVRRINNGPGVVAAGTFDNTLGTVIAFDIDNLTISYDLTDGVSNVRMNAADLQVGGACGVDACFPNQIRKVNIIVSGRSRLAMRGTRQFFRNRLFTQVSLRSMAFLDRYR